MIRIDLPPLRERTEDIPLLAMHFLEKHRSQKGTPVTEIAIRRHAGPLASQLAGKCPRAGKRDQGGDRPGRRIGSCTATTCRSRSLREPSHAPRSSSLLDVERSLPDLTCDLIGQVEREYFVRLLSQYKGNVARCARHSGLSRRSVTQKLQKYGLERAEFKGPRRQGSFDRVTLMQRTHGKVDILEFEFERDRDHLARGLVDELVIGRFAGCVHEEILEAELAAVGARVVENRRCVQTASRRRAGARAGC